MAFWRVSSLLYFLCVLLLLLLHLLSYLWWIFWIRYLNICWIGDAVVSNLKYGETGRKIWTKCCSRRRSTRMFRKEFWRSRRIWLLRLAPMIKPKYVWRLVQFTHQWLCCFAWLILWILVFGFRFWIKESFKSLGRSGNRSCPVSSGTLPPLLCRKPITPKLSALILLTWLSVSCVKFILPSTRLAAPRSRWFSTFGFIVSCIICSFWGTQLDLFKLIEFVVLKTFVVVFILFVIYFRFEICAFYVLVMLVCPFSGVPGCESIHFVAAFLFLWGFLTLLTFYWLTHINKGFHLLSKRKIRFDI